MASRANDDGRPPMFGAVARNQTLAEKVADTLVEAIRSGELKPGDRLPAERDLVEEFNVSRGVVREAIGALVGKGLVTAHGRRGIEVNRLSSEQVSESMTLYLRSSATVDFHKVHQIRTALEIEMVARAAENVSDAMLDKLRSAAAALPKARGRKAAARADFEFHRAIAEATDNELFVVVLDSISDALVEVRETGFRTPGTVEYASTSHDEILDRIAAGDASGAREAMAAHLAEAEKRLVAAQG